MVILDATTLLLLIDPKARPPLDPSTRKPLDRCKDRLEFLRDSLSEAGTRVVIPTPVLSEVLVGAGAARSQYLTEITTSHAFLVAPFDVKAAVELSFLLDGGAKPTKRKLTRQETWAKVKFDRQIIAIARANRIKEIYTDDGNLTSVATANDVAVHHTWELPLPPQKQQQELDLPVPGNKDA